MRLDQHQAFLSLLEPLFFVYSTFNSTNIMTDVENTEKDAAPAYVESAGAPQSHQFVHIDPAVQKRVVRKLDLNLMPLVMALCELSSIHHLHTQR
jgi:hypothetical protein